jgi:hypothetical protein
LVIDLVQIIHEMERAGLGVFKLFPKRLAMDGICNTFCVKWTPQNWRPRETSSPEKCTSFMSWVDPEESLKPL